MKSCFRALFQALPALLGFVILLAMHLLIDGKNLAYRAFYGMPELKRASDNFPTGAVYGFTKTLLKLTEDYSNVAATLEVFWDAGSAHREELHAEYKAQRKPIPDDLKAQLPTLEKLVSLMGITSWKEEGHEADDLIATRAKELATEGREVLIVSADKDFAQLVNEKINLLSPPPTVSPKDAWRHVGPKEVLEKFGVEPSQIADYLALMGDAADNIFGLEGVGPKTASNWLSKYKNIEGILDNSGKLTPARFQNIVYSSKDLLYKNRELTTLRTVELGPQNRTEGNRNAEELVKLYLSLEMKSTAAEVARRFGVEVKA